MLLGCDLRASELIWGGFRIQRPQDGDISTSFMLTLLAICACMHSNVQASVRMFSVSTWPLTAILHFRLVSISIFVFLTHCPWKRTVMTRKAKQQGKKKITSGHWSLMPEANIKYFHYTDVFFQWKYLTLKWHRTLAAAVNHLIPTVSTAWLLQTCLGASPQLEWMFLAQAHIV